MHRPLDPSLEQALGQALAHHKAGRLAVAEQGYRGILAGTPDEPRALQLLGTIALQTGHLGEAETLPRAALGRAPQSAEACARPTDRCARGSMISSRGRGCAGPTVTRRCRRRCFRALAGGWRWWCVLAARLGIGCWRRLDPVLSRLGDSAILALSWLHEGSVGVDEFGWGVMD